MSMPFDKMNENENKGKKEQKKYMLNCRQLTTRNDLSIWRNTKVQQHSAKKCVNARSHWRRLPKVNTNRNKTIRFEVVAATPIVCVLASLCLAWCAWITNFLIWLLNYSDVFISRVSHHIRFLSHYHWCIVCNDTGFFNLVNLYRHLY